MYTTRNIEMWFSDMKIELEWLVDDLRNPTISAHDKIDIVEATLDYVSTLLEDIKLEVI